VGDSREVRKAWDTFRSVLDVLSSVALIVAAVALVWFIYSRGDSVPPVSGIDPPEAPVSINGSKQGSDIAPGRVD